MDSRVKGEDSGALDCKGKPFLKRGDIFGRGGPEVVRREESELNLKMVKLVLRCAIILDKTAGKVGTLRNCESDEAKLRQSGSIKEWWLMSARRKAGKTEIMD